MIRTFFFKLNFNFNSNLENITNSFLFCSTTRSYFFDVCICKLVTCPTFSSQLMQFEAFDSYLYQQRSTWRRALSKLRSNFLSNFLYISRWFAGGVSYKQASALLWYAMFGILHNKIHNTHSHDSYAICSCNIAIQQEKKQQQRIESSWRFW